MSKTAYLLQGVIIFLLLIGVLTSFFTLFVSNVGATVLLVPFAINLALASGADPAMPALRVRTDCDT